MKKKVIILHNIMAPYRFPLFAEIAKNRDFELEVWFLSESAKNRRWRIRSGIRLPFKYRVLPKIEFNFWGKDLFTFILNPTFPFELIKSKYDVVISAGWLDFASWAAFSISKILGKPFILWSESTAYEPSWRRTAAGLWVKMIIRGADACIAAGTRARQYLERLGASPQKIFVAYSTVDIKHFEKGSQLLPKEKKSLKEKLGIKNRKLILFVGQLIERKGIKYLLSAYERIKRKYPDVGLLIVGYGPQKEELMNFCQEKSLKDVYFVGHVELDEMPKIYALADIFVLPSTEETWGLVINEAMASGLPVVTTDKVGSCLDLIKEGENGYVASAGSVKKLQKAIEKVISKSRLLKKMGENSSKLIKNFGPDKAAQAFVKAIDYAGRHHERNLVKFYQTSQDYFSLMEKTHKRKYYKPVLELLAEHKVSLKEKKVLDVGSGTGTFLGVLKKVSKSSFEAVGVDISPIGEKFHKRRKIKFVLGDAQRLPFQDESFDFVFSIDALEHIASPAKALSQMCRVTKKGGFVLLRTRNYRSPLTTLSLSSLAGFAGDFFGPKKDLSQTKKLKPIFSPRGGDKDAISAIDADLLSASFEKLPGEMLVFKTWTKGGLWQILNKLPLIKLMGSMSLLLFKKE